MVLSLLFLLSILSTTYQLDLPVIILFDVYETNTFYMQIVMKVNLFVIIDANECVCIDDISNYRLESTHTHKIIEVKT